MVAPVLCHLEQSTSLCNIFVFLFQSSQSFTQHAAVPEQSTAARLAWSLYPYNCHHQKILPHWICNKQLRHYKHYHFWHYNYFQEHQPCCKYSCSSSFLLPLGKHGFSSSFLLPLRMHGRSSFLLALGKHGCVSIGLLHLNKHGSFPSSSCQSTSIVVSAGSISFLHRR